MLRGTMEGMQMLRRNLLKQKTGNGEEFITQHRSRPEDYYGNYYLLTIILYNEAAPWRFNNLI